MLMYSLCLLCSFSELLLTVISCNACALCHWVSIKATYLLTYLLTIMVSPSLDTSEMVHTAS